MLLNWTLLVWIWMMDPLDQQTQVSAWTSSTTVVVLGRRRISPRRRRNPPSTHRVDPSTRMTSTSKEDENDPSSLTELDARVLREMLQKEEIEQTETLQKLLERGVTKSTTTFEEKDEETPYASQALQTLADTKLWKAIQRNDWWESIQLAIANKVERDTKLLASLGLFAWDRIQQDVARALPASITKPKKKKKKLPIEGGC